MDLIYVKGKSNKKELIMTLLVPVLLGVLSFLVVENHTQIYATAEGVMPPIIIFPLIWAFVLISMGLASYRMKLVAPESFSHASYAVALLLAFIWNIFLLRFEKLTFSFVTIIIYLVFLFITFFEFEKVDSRAGLLMIPALFWGSALAVINFWLCRLHGVV